MNSIAQTLQAELEELTCRRDELLRQKEPIDKELQRIFKQQRSLRERLGQIRVAAMGDEPDFTDILDILADDSRSSTAEYRYFDKQMREKFSFGHAGYLEETKQINLVIQLYDQKSDTLAKICAGIMKFAPAMRPLYDGFLRFSVSGGRSIAVKVNPRMTIFKIVVDEFRGRDRELAEFGDVVSCVKHLIAMTEAASDDDY